ncbi:SDR family oxidoreductase [Hylemonella sp. W303a]|uniref:SDR family oxidoreductase n=1 Tax=Hylemonella sp. W303a TaxID=3389873 RepID=UPI00396B0ACA
MKLQNARVLLTGASGGIGATMDQALRQAGAQVLGVSRAPQASAPGQHWVRADLNDPSDIEQVAKRCAALDINVVVHAAGEAGFGALRTLDATRMQQVLQTNLLAPMLLTQALLPQLQRQPQAQIVFVGSALGAIGLPGFSLYGTSKAGVHRFAESLRRELSDTSVRVQLLAPRSTRTAFNSGEAEAYNRATGTASDSPETVAQALIRLIRDEAAERYIGWPERLAARLNGAVGPLLDGSFEKHRRHLNQTQTQTQPIQGATS